MYSKAFSKALQESRRRMLKGGLAPAVVRRMTRELEDHYADTCSNLQAEGLSATDADRQAREQVGDLESISDAALAKPELQSVISRYPKVSLLLAPFVIFILTALAIIAVFVALFSINPIPEGGQPPAWFFFLIQVVKIFYLFLLPAVLAISVAVLGRNRLISPLLVAVAVLLVAFVGSWMNIYMHQSTEPGSSSIGATLNLLGFVPGWNRIVLDVLLISCLRIAATCALAVGAWYFLPGFHLDTDDDKQA